MKPQISVAVLIFGIPTVQSLRQQDKVVARLPEDGVISGRLEAPDLLDLHQRFVLREIAQRFFQIGVSGPVHVRVPGPVRACRPPPRDMLIEIFAKPVVVGPPVHAWRAEDAIPDNGTSVVAMNAEAKTWRPLHEADFHERATALLIDFLGGKNRDPPFAWPRTVILKASKKKSGKKARQVASALFGSDLSAARHRST